VATASVLLVLGPTAGPAPADDRGTTTSTHSMTVDGEHRTYRLVVPETGSEGAPLVVALHGLRGSGERFQRVSGWDDVAVAAGAVLAYPDSYAAGWRSRPEETADVTFLSRLIQRIARRQGTDPRRVYVVGSSSGAFMTYRLACDRAGLVAAIGPVAGAPVMDCSTPPSRPVPVISMHGREDAVVPYDGGQPQPPGKPPSDVDLPSAHQTAKRWAAHNGCRPEPRRARTGAVVTKTWGHCDRRAWVRLVVLGGWPHQYPTTQAGAPADAPTLQWSFLQAYRLPAPR
jgi:polyhydroxybutyrate depolymerase